MIILDRVLTVNRLKKHLAQLTETMEAHSTYKKAINLAKKMADLIGDDESLKRITFALNELKSEKVYKILEHNNRHDRKQYQQTGNRKPKLSLCNNIKIFKH